MDIHLIAYYIGIFIVFASHIYVLSHKPTDSIRMHSLVNLIAGVLIAYYFMNKEQFITF